MCIKVIFFTHPLTLTVTHLKYFKKGCYIVVFCHLDKGEFCFIQIIYSFISFRIYVLSFFTVKIKTYPHIRDSVG